MVLIGLIVPTTLGFRNREIKGGDFTVLLKQTNYIQTYYIQEIILLKHLSSNSPLFADFYEMDAKFIINPNNSVTCNITNN